MAFPEINLQRQRRTSRASVAAAVGNTIETYEYASFGFLATVLASVFFPKESSTAALLSTFAVFGTAFLVRPLGSVFFGILTDRLGRKPVLVVTVVGMSVMTGLIGLLPTPESMGISATVLLVLLRVTQGLMVGGEYTTAVIYATEFAPAHRRPEMASRVQVGSVVGLLLAALVVVGLSANLSPDQMHDWGWRVPFLLGLPLGAIGLYLRAQLGETPEFEEVKIEAREGEDPPIRTATTIDPTSKSFWHHGREIFLIAGVAVLHTIGFYMTYTYMQSLLAQLGLGLFESTTVIVVALVVGVVAVISGGLLSNRIGARRVLLLSSAGTLLVAWPLWDRIVASGESGSMGVIVVCVALVSGLPALYASSTPVVYGTLAGVARRGVVTAVAYGVTVSLLGGAISFVAQWIVNETGDPRSPALLLMAAALISGIAAFNLPKTVGGGQQ
ncbi:MFS transporter [Brevibacterium oceani]|uniref:MFS transporter n=1 Tax=Brevibacterium oceani TaxID=358099 RepID=UPI0015E78C62|nr:MFS transporter [Brevibacterium oceani]